MFKTTVLIIFLFLFPNGIYNPLLNTFTSSLIINPLLVSPGKGTTGMREGT